MLNLMPKTSELLEQIGNLEPYIKKYKKIEIQFFPNNTKILDFDFEPTIKKYCSMFELNEITIHPPLYNFDIEAVLFYDFSILKRQLKTCVRLSKQYNIKINLLYHTHWQIQYQQYNIFNKIKQLLKIIDGQNVTLLIENLYLLSEERTEFSSLLLVKAIDHPQLKMCFDICHAHCQSNMFEIPIETLLENKFSNIECEKYIYQIHFSYTANNDGFKDKSTHGVGHPTEESLLNDCKLLEKYNLMSKQIVTEIAEDDYHNRKSQIQDINWLEKNFS